MRAPLHVLTRIRIMSEQNRVRHDDPSGSDGLAELVAVIFSELRRMAHRQLSRERGHATLQTTELVHEAYLRLVAQPEVAGRGKAYFFASAARAMRQVLVDASRRRNAGRRASTLPTPCQHRCGPPDSARNRRRCGMTL